MSEEQRKKQEKKKKKDRWKLIVGVAAVVSTAKPLVKLFLGKK